MKVKKLEDYKRVNYRDERIPLAIRRAAYYKWAEENGIDRKEAVKRARRMFDFPDFTDESQPLGKRKVSYVRWKMRNGTDINTAKVLANRIFGKD